MSKHSLVVNISCHIQTTQQDEKGFSALRWAIERGHKEIAKILEGKVKRKNQHKQSPAIFEFMLEAFLTVFGSFFFEKT